MLRVFLLVILFIFYTKASTLEEANKALKNSEITTAIKLYKELTKLGNEEAIFKLGTIYFKGNGVKKDLNIAMQYFKRAALYNNKKAKYNVGIIYANKRYKFHSLKKAFDIFNDLAKSGHGPAQNKVAIFLTYGLGIEKDYKLAVQWLEQAYFKSKYFPASCNLAFMFADGRGVFPNFGRARILAQKGYEKKLPMCVKVYKEYKLHKYKQDKAFKFGYYRDLE
jgi:TPR repeat protein